MFDCFYIVWITIKDETCSTSTTAKSETTAPPQPWTSTASGHDDGSTSDERSYASTGHARRPTRWSQDASPPHGATSPWTTRSSAQPPRTTRLPTQQLERAQAEWWVNILTRLFLICDMGYEPLSVCWVSPPLPPPSFWLCCFQWVFWLTGFIMKSCKLLLLEYSFNSFPVMVYFLRLLLSDNSFIVSGICYFWMFNLTIKMFLF